MGTNGSDPCGASIAVVAGIGDVMHVYRVKEASPCMQGVVGFDDIFATVVEIAVAQKEAESYGTLADGHMRSAAEMFDCS